MFPLSLFTRIPYFGAQLCFSFSPSIHKDRLRPRGLTVPGLFFFSYVFSFDRIVLREQASILSTLFITPFTPFMLRWALTFLLRAVTSPPPRPPLQLRRYPFFFPNGFTPFFFPSLLSCLRMSMNEVVRPFSHCFSPPLIENPLLVGLF